MTLPDRQSVSDAETLGSLFARLVEDGKRFARAEIGFYKQVAVGRIAGLKTAAILLVVAVLLVQASLTTLLVGIGFGIARLLPAIGIAGGVIVAAVIGLLVSGLLVRSAIGRLSAAAPSGDELKGPAR